MIMRFKLFLTVMLFGLCLPAPAQFRRSSDHKVYPYTNTLLSSDVFIIGRITPDTNYNYAYSNLATLITNAATSVTTNLGISASTVTNIANYLIQQSNTFNGVGLTNIQCTNIVIVTKRSFSTNYTVNLTDQVLACAGTNQLLTLPNGTNNVPDGTIFCFLMSSTTGDGSAIVTNANGVQTILTATNLTQTITNGQSLTVLWDGANWR
jgi:hypothetical protein